MNITHPYMQIIYIGHLMWPNMKLDDNLISESLCVNPIIGYGL